MPTKLLLQGKKFNRLLVLQEQGKNKLGNILWLCQCDCGAKTIVQGRFLKKGLIKSCGCYAKEKLKQRLTTHGLTGHPLRNVWNGIKQRCSNKNNLEYKNYGARGIKVCERWLIFKNFYDDIISGYIKGMEIERIDNNGNYEPKNCKWATHRQQNRNKRTNHLLECNGQKLSLVEWGEKLNIKPNTILTRIRRGWEINKALEIANK